MCRHNCQAEVKAVTGFQSGEQAQPVKSTFRLSPFRKVAKSARINLNRYWGILSQSAAMKPSARITKSSSETQDYSKEMEQNRMNEILEAQMKAAIAQNQRNLEFENSPDFQVYRRQQYLHFRSSSIQSWTSSEASSSMSFESDSLDTISQDSVFL